MRITLIGALLAAAAAASAPAPAEPPASPGDAPALELDLKRATLENIPDKAGLWQIEGGPASQDGKHTANYASTKRVTKQATDEQNTAAVTMTIFFLGKKPPENITVEGSHDFGSGDEVGSVSAASGQYAAYIGKSFSRKGDKVTIK